MNNLQDFDRRLNIQRDKEYLKSILKGVNFEKTDKDNNKHVEYMLEGLIKDLKEVKS